MKTARFETPDHIPVSFWINLSCWNHYPSKALKELIVSHPLLFPDDSQLLQADNPQYAPYQCKNRPFKDDWGCIWETTENGITGTVTKHPLEKWEYFENYLPPDPSRRMGIGPIDWPQTAKDFEEGRKRGAFLGVGLRHGHTFLQLCDLRGYVNLLYDMADGDPRLFRLIKMVEEFNMAIVRRYAELKPDAMYYAEDIGMQTGPMLSPEYFRKYIKPSYQNLMKPAKEAGCLVHMHSDGDIRSLFEDIVESGVDVINLQDAVNGIDWIKQNIKGRICIELDIDRQGVTRFGTPSQIEEFIYNEVKQLASKRGGLMLLYGLYPWIPLENVKALMDCMEKYAHFDSK